MQGGKLLALCMRAGEPIKARFSMHRQTMPAHAPLDDIRDLIRALPDGNDVAGAATRILCRRGTAFEGGALENMAVWLSTWSGKTPPLLNKPVVAMFAGAHGIVRHGVPGPTETQVRDYVAAVSAGQGVLGRLCTGGNIGLKMLDLALDVPTGDATQDAALDERGCAATIAFGMEAVAGGHDLICLSSIGAGGETSAAVLLAAIYDGKATPWLGSGPRQDVALREAAAVEAALALHKAVPGDPIEMMRRLAGREIAAMVGAIIAARVEKVPVVLDGLTAFAAAAVLQHVRPDAMAHCVLAAQPPLARACEAARVAGLECLAVESSGAGPGVDAAIGVGLLRAAVLAA